MSHNKLIHWSIILFGYLAVLYPLWERTKTLQWAFDQSLFSNLFPFFGLAAAGLLWLHSISGVFEPWLRKHIDFDRFVRVTSALILWSIILHPLLLLMMFQFNINDIFIIYGMTPILIGIIAWLLLITYDIGKALKKRRQFFVMHWNKILIVSNIGFLLAFFHSLNVGSDLSPYGGSPVGGQFNPLRAVWIFYGITAILAILYTYGVKKMAAKKITFAVIFSCNIAN